MDDQEGKKDTKGVGENQNKDAHSLEAPNEKHHDKSQRGEAASLQSSYKRQDDDEEKQLAMVNSSEGHGEAKVPRQEDMEAAAELVIALDDDDTTLTNDAHTTVYKLKSKHDWPQLSPTQELEIETASPVMNASTFLVDEATLPDMNTIPTELETPKDNTEQRVAVVSDRQQHSIPRESARREVQHGAFYEGGRNAREVVPDDESSAGSHTGTQLVSAEVVDPEEMKRVVERELAEQRRNAAVAEVVTGFWCSSRVKVMSVVGLMLVILAVVLGTVLAQVLEPPEPPSPLPGLIELLSAKSSDGGAALQSASSPQNNAVKWLSGNTNLGNYTDERKIQRYVLATLYYSTSGDNWENNRAWLSNSNECSWHSNYESFCSESTVNELGLYYNNLDGAIPVELALLSNTLGKNLMVPSPYCIF